MSEQLPINPQEKKKEMDFETFLSRAKGLLKKGYTAEVHNGRIDMLTPDGKQYLSVMEAVYADETGENPRDINAPDMANELGLNPNLAERIFEAETDEDVQWPKYRQGLEEALGIEKTQS